uniref:Chromo domain-containing protein n=1 Tax=Leptobrachium leishanense TaxID=445787 RepID=A0A8C5QJ45_9ANUR
MLLSQIVVPNLYLNFGEYLVHWKGYGPADHTWVSLRDIHAPRLLSAFHRRFPVKPAPDRPVGVPRVGGAVSPRRLARLRCPPPAVLGSASSPQPFLASCARVPPVPAALGDCRRRVACDIITPPTWVPPHHVTLVTNQTAGRTQKGFY